MYSVSAVFGAPSPVIFEISPAASLQMTSEHVMCPHFRNSGTSDSDVLGRSHTEALQEPL